MRFDKLHHTELNVSCAALGTDSYGSTLDREQSFTMLDSFVSQGGNLIDTAESYCRWIPGAEYASENVIGEWLKSRRNRHNIIISTKGAHFLPNQKPRLSRADIMSDLEGSLKRLHTDYIDVYWLHRDDISTPVEEIMTILNDAVRSGSVRYIGVSNWTHQRFDEANRYAAATGLVPLVSSQIQYSPANPNIDKNEPDLVLMNDGEYEYFKQHDYSVFAFASQAKGFFSKYLAGGEAALSPKAHGRYLNPETLSRYENLKTLSEDKGCSIGQAVIAALVNNPDFQTIPIIGCKNTEQLTESLSGCDIGLTRAEVDFIFNRCM